MTDAPLKSYTRGASEKIYFRPTKSIKTDGFYHLGWRLISVIEGSILTYTDIDSWLEARLLWSKSRRRNTKIDQILK